MQAFVFSNTLKSSGMLTISFSHAQRLPEATVCALAQFAGHTRAATACRY